MSSFHLETAFAWLAASSMAFAQAPTASAAKAPPPASVPSGNSLSYRSAFEGYLRFADQPILPWREANDTVGRIGGWQAYAREGQGSPPAGNDSSAAPAATGHAGMHGILTPPSGTAPPMPSAASTPGASLAPVKTERIAKPAASSASAPASADHSEHHKP